MQPFYSVKGFQATGEAFVHQRKHPALQNMKIFSLFFGGLFFSSLIRICIPNPDTDQQTVLKYGSNRDLDLKQWSLI